MRIKTFLRYIFSTLGYRCIREAHFPRALDPCNDVRQFPGFGPVRTVLDVGANIGQSVDRFLHEFPRAKIISCEPVPLAFSTLVRKFASESRVHCENIALGATTGLAIMQLVGETAEQNQILRDDGSNSVQGLNQISVRMDTLDNLLAKLDVDSVDFLKIDTEGFEMDVLAGGVNALDSGRIRSIMAECSFIRDDAQHTYFPILFSFLESRGFSFMGLYEHSYHEGYLSYCNALFIRTKSLSEMRLREEAL